MKVQYLFQNHKGRDFVCGDIHGCFDLLEDKLTEIDFDPQLDRLFCVGDIIDRGFNSAKALYYLQQNWFYCIRGNHEQMMLEWCKEKNANFRQNAFRFHMHNGGLWIADHLGVHIQKLADDVCLDGDITKLYPGLKKWIEAIDQLPFAIEVKAPHKKIGLVHAEIPAQIKWQSLEAELHKPNVSYSILYSRKYIHSSHKRKYQIKGVDEIYCGHTIVEYPQRIGNINYIDTGAFSHQNLTLVEINYS